MQSSQRGRQPQQSAKQRQLFTENDQFPSTYKEIHSLKKKYTEFGGQTLRTEVNEQLVMSAHRPRGRHQKTNSMECSTFRPEAEQQETF